MAALSPVRKGMKCFYLHARTSKKDVFGTFLPYERVCFPAWPSMELQLFLALYLDQL